MEVQLTFISMISKFLFIKIKPSCHNNDLHPAWVLSCQLCHLLDCSMPGTSLLLLLSWSSCINMHVLRTVDDAINKRICVAFFPLPRFETLAAREESCLILQPKRNVVKNPTSLAIFTKQLKLCHKSSYRMF